MYTVSSGVWGEGGPQKADKRNKISWCDGGSVKKSDFADILYGSPQSRSLASLIRHCARSCGRHFCHGRLTTAASACNDRGGRILTSDHRISLRCFNLSLFASSGCYGCHTLHVVHAWKIIFWRHSTCQGVFPKIFIFHPQKEPCHRFTLTACYTLILNAVFGLVLLALLREHSALIRFVAPIPDNRPVHHLRGLYREERPRSPGPSPGIRLMAPRLTRVTIGHDHLSTC